MEINLLSLDDEVARLAEKERNSSLISYIYTLTIELVINLLTSGRKQLFHWKNFQFYLEKRNSEKAINAIVFAKLVERIFDMEMHF